MEPCAGASPAGGRSGVGAEQQMRDFHGTDLIFGLCFFGCAVHEIQRALQAYGFRCSVRDLIRHAHRFKLVMYNKLAHPANGPDVCTVSQPVQSSRTVDYVDGKAMAMTHQCTWLRARAPRYELRICSSDGRRISVEFSQGQLQIRAEDPLDGL